MNDIKMNLNHLKALDALLTEVSVSKAASRLHLSQSALSNILTQLRVHFQDDLLVRGGKRMILTPKAESLKPELHRLLQELKALVTTQPGFDPLSSRRIFRVGMSDVAEMLLLPDILKILQKHAPHIQIHIFHVTHITQVKQFKEQELDLVMGCLVDDNPHICKAPCIQFGGMVVGRKDHPLLQQPLTLKKFLSAPQIRIQYQTGLGGTNIDKELKQLKVHRNVVASVPHVIPVPFMLRRSDMIASIPNIFSQQWIKKFNLISQPLPFDLPKRYTFTAWLRKDDKDKGLIWLRSLISQITAEIQHKIDAN